MANSPISNFLVTADTYLDYIPFVSLATNATVLVAKIALSFFAEYCPQCFAEIRENPLVHHVFEQKHSCLCILLAIPFLNIFVAFLRDVPDLQVEPPANASGGFNEQLEQLRAQLDQQKERTQQRVAEVEAGRREHEKTTLQGLEEDRNKLLLRLKQYDNLSAEGQNSNAPAGGASIDPAKIQLIATMKQGQIQMFQSRVRATQSLLNSNGSNVDFSHLLVFSDETLAQS